MRAFHDLYLKWVDAGREPFSHQQAALELMEAIMLNEGNEEGAAGVKRLAAKLKADELLAVKSRLAKLEDK